MHKSRKQWHFGMKLHSGADSQMGLVHSASVTAANVHDSREIPNLLHGHETRLYGDSPHRGKAQRMRLRHTPPRRVTEQQCAQMGTAIDSRGASGVSQNDGNERCHRPNRAADEI
jgi:IS5 family transposase